MTAPLRLPHDAFVDRPTRDQSGVSIMKNPAEKGIDHIAASRRAFAALLWRAFPSPSEHDLAEKAARVLDVSPRQVKNWLRCEHSAAVHHFLAVAAVAGAEVVFRGIEGRG
jgi:hypothetical protein